MHEIRDRERHFQNTWEWDAWGFTADWADGCTLSDMDGFYGHFAEVSDKFLIMEVKHWDGALPLPQVPNSGQAKALKRLSQREGFFIVWAWGNTATREIHSYEVWYDGKVKEFDGTPLKQFLGDWFKWARSN